jgi:hypothetical protein
VRGVHLIVRPVWAKVIRVVQVICDRGIPQAANDREKILACPLKKRGFWAPTPSALPCPARASIQFLNEIDVLFD